MSESKYPAGWNAERVTALIERQESLTEDEQVAEDEAAMEQRSGQAIVSVPDELLPAIRKLLADRKSA